MKGYPSFIFLIISINFFLLRLCISFAAFKDFLVNTLKLLKEFPLQLVSLTEAVLLQRIALTVFFFFFYVCVLLILHRTLKHELLKNNMMMP